MTLTMEDMMPRVLKGAAWLDEKRPGWVSMIDLNILRLDDCARCALGQCFGHYDRGMRKLTREYEGGYLPIAGDHGFAAIADPERRESWNRAHWDMLRECWVTVILERRFKEQSTAADASSVPDAVDVLVESRCLSTRAV